MIWEWIFDPIKSLILWVIGAMPGIPEAMQQQPEVTMTLTQWLNWGALFIDGTDFGVAIGIILAINILEGALAFINWTIRKIPGIS